MTRRNAEWFVCSELLGRMEEMTELYTVDLQTLEAVLTLALHGSVFYVDLYKRVLAVLNAAEYVGDAEKAEALKSRASELLDKIQ